MCPSFVAVIANIANFHGHLKHLHVQLAVHRVCGRSFLASSCSSPPFPHVAFPSFAMARMQYVDANQMMIIGAVIWEAREFQYQLCREA